MLIGMNLALSFADLNVKDSPTGQGRSQPKRDKTSDSASAADSPKPCSEFK